MIGALAGAFFTFACILTGYILFKLFELVIDMIRNKLGLPVARYVRWVKQQDEIDKGGEK